MRCLKELTAETQQQIMTAVVDNYTQEDLVRALQILVSHSFHFKISPFLVSTNYYDDVVDPAIDDIINRLLEEEQRTKEAVEG